MISNPADMGDKSVPKVRVVSGPYIHDIRHSVEFDLPATVDYTQFKEAMVKLMNTYNAANIAFEDEI